MTLTKSWPKPPTWDRSWHFTAQFSTVDNNQIEYLWAKRCWMQFVWAELIIRKTKTKKRPQIVIMCALGQLHRLCFRKKTSHEKSHVYQVHSWTLAILSGEHGLSPCHTEASSAASITSNCHFINGPVSPNFSTILCSDTNMTKLQVCW